MFAAASNNRHNERNSIAYPARDDAHIICINSVDGRYKRSTFSPEGRHLLMNFSAIGEYVEAAWPLGLGGNQGLQRRMNGTSCATAIAAGIAALILEYAIQAESLEELRIENVEALRRTAGMKKACSN
jgi:Subtilase family